MRPVEARGVRLDACRPCQVVWFDAGERGALPSLPAEPAEPPLPPAAVEILARARAEAVAERARLRDGTAPPDTWWGVVAGALGLPVETGAPGPRRRAWATWSLAGALAVVSLLALLDLDGAVRTLGLVPAHAWRFGGATFITSFFLHAGVLHLLGNLYFLLVFGDDVEDALGRRPFLALIATSALAGAALHAAFDPRPEVPVVGASAGISGVLVFYALAFPRARLTFLWWFRWVRVPARAYLALWVLLQVALAVRQLGGTTNVSALGHLGGAAVGLAFWLRCRRDRSARRGGPSLARMS